MCAGRVQHLLDAGPRRRGDRRDRHAGVRLEGRVAGGILGLHAGRADRSRRQGRLPRPQLVVDDGGDVTLLIHKGYELEERQRVGRMSTSVLARGAGDQGPAEARPRRAPGHLARPWSRTGAASPRRPRPACIACTSWPRRSQLLIPAINVNDSVTKIEVRQPVRLPRVAGRRHQARDGRDAGRQGRRGLRLRRRRQGLRAFAAGYGSRVIVTEIDPINALQAAMEGFEVNTDRETRWAAATSTSPPPATRT